MGPHRIPGWISSDRKLLVLGKWLPLSGDPRAWRRDVLSKLPGARSGSGRLVIHDFADLQCAFCKKRTAAVEEYLRSHPALGATVEFHFFPLYQGHPWSVVSASAGKCLSSSIGADTFFLYAHGVFERQEALDADTVRSFAGDVAASAGSREKWDRCMAAKEGEKKALRDLEAGFELGVRATPTFFVDGTMVSGDDGVLERFLEQMAAAAGPVRKGP